MHGMNTKLGSKTVVGEATKVGDTIILPLVDVSFGVGAGASDGDKKNSAAGGFAAKMSPSAVLVIKNGQTKLVNIKNQVLMIFVQLFSLILMEVKNLTQEGWIFLIFIYR